MDKLLWLDLNWNLIVFLVAVVVSIIVILKVARVAGLLLLTLVLYLGVDWHMWSWVPWLFWALWLLGVLFVVVTVLIHGGALVSALCAFGAAAIVVIAFVFSGLGALGDWFGGDGQKAALHSNSGSILKPISDTKCPSTWVMKKTSPSNGDIVEDVPSIRNAKSKADARAAANDWVDLVKDNPGTLSGAASVVLEKDVKRKGLVDNDGCATPQAKSVVEQMKVALALSDIAPDQAPADGYNSGAVPASGRVYTYARPGVSGNRVAVRITLRNGHTMWVMARCGNIVTHKPSPHLPQPKPKTPPTPYCVMHPTAPKCLTPKDPTKDVLVNPNVPDQVKGHGTTPVGTSPGPAVKPVDSSTGCDGPCPSSGGSSPTPTSPTPDPVMPSPIATDPPNTGTVDPPPPPPAG